MGIFNLVTRSDVCREFNCHPDSIKRWIKEEGFPEPLPCPAREPVFDADAVNDWIRGNYGQFALDVLWYFKGKHLEEIENEISN
ncbi:helix-turn-helix transcriptional regulator [Alphaproteobacteria bacterium LSUCC0684]